MFLTASAIATVAVISAAGAAALIDKVSGRRRRLEAQYDAEFATAVALDDAQFDWDELSAETTWSELSAHEQDEILASYDQLHTEGRLGNVPFYRQWLDHRTSAHA